MSVLPPPPDSAGTDKPPVRTELGSEAQVSAEDQFRLALHEKQPSQSGAAPPLPSFEQMAKKEPLPPLQNEIPAGQRSQLEAAVLERTKQLNRLFEDQVKKQYDAMRREVSKLAKAHQKDVQALDARFKSKMAGLASRFKQLEEEEAQVRLVKQENEDLQQEIERLVKLMEEQDRRNDASLATIAERDTTITTLSEQIVRLKEQQQQMQLEMEQRMRQANAAQAELESTVEGLQKTIGKKKADLKEMQQRLVNVKNTYDTEVIRKQAEVSELEGSMRQLQRYTQQMSSFTSQVQGQIMTREQDMKVQLGLMKNTIAFALYIDETLQVDLTDPHSTTLLTRPVTVFPSGVTYSSETVEKLQEEAKRRGTVAKCPQTGEEITGTAPNHVVESVLSRYLFKQQITKDVMHALNEYQTKTPAGEEDQPLELYLQRMKASMVERLEGMHNEAMQKSQFSYQQQLELKAMESESRGKEGAASAREGGGGGDGGAQGEARGAAAPRDAADGEARAAGGGRGGRCRQPRGALVQRGAEPRAEGRPAADARGARAAQREHGGAEEAARGARRGDPGAQGRARRPAQGARGREARHGLADRGARQPAEEGEGARARERGDAVGPREDAAEPREGVRIAEGVE